MVSMAKGKKPTNPAILHRCPEYRDHRALMEHGIAAIVRVSQCDDLALAVKAIQWLVKYAESRMNGKHQPKEGAPSTVSPDGSPQWRVC